MGNAQLFAQRANLHLVQLGEGLDDLARGDHFLDQRHPVVMGLDGVRPLGAAGLDGVGVDGALT